MDLSQEVITRLRKVCGESPSIALHEPNICETELSMVEDCLKSGWVSSVGKYVDRFERDLASYTGAKHAIATVNGTAALHISLLLAGVRASDEVLCPALSFIATANAIRYCNATPHFVDVAPDTMGMCPERLNSHLLEIVKVRDNEPYNSLTGKRIAAVLPMHTFGTPVELDSIADVCARFRLPLVEDAAESLGSTYRGVHTGVRGLLSAVSFNGNKIITAGGGGAVLTNDSDLAKRAKHLTTTAKLPHAWEFNHDEIGYNYRMPNLNAALAVAQLSRIDGFLASKRHLHELYRQAFAGFDGVTVFEPPKHSRSNHWLNSLLINNGRQDRDRVLQAGMENGIGARPIWNLLSMSPMYKDCPKSDLSQSHWFAERVVSLPSSPSIVRDYQQRHAA